MHWTIIGGGIQGTAIAQKLLSSGHRQTINNH